MIRGKRIVCAVLFFCILALGNVSNQTMVYASENEGMESVGFEPEIEIVAYDSENNRSLAKVLIRDANADVYGNGVRLRTAPNTSSTILELMYDGEYVWIDWSKYGRGEGGFSWYYIQRIKTGTYGWASTEYIGSRD